MRHLSYEFGNLVSHSDLRQVENYLNTKIREKLGISDAYAGQCFKQVMDDFFQFKEPKNHIRIQLPPQEAE